MIVCIEKGGGEIFCLCRMSVLIEDGAAKFSFCAGGGEIFCSCVVCDAMLVFEIMAGVVMPFVRIQC